jgi:hypothetical protein
MNPSFRVYFNNKKSWVDVYLYDVHPDTFAGWGAGRWAYWQEEGCKTGLFGTLHFIKNRLRIDTVTHEISHLRQAWLRANLNAWTGRNEESVIEFGDRLLWGFLRALAKEEPKARVWMRSLGEL